MTRVILKIKHGTMQPPPYLDVCFRLITLCVAGFFFGDFPARAQTAAARANDFLNSLGTGGFLDQGASTDKVIHALSYGGWRTARDSAAPSRLIPIHAATGIKFDVFPAYRWRIPELLARADALAGAGALLAVEGPNEPNNWPVKYKGRKSNAGTFGPVAEFQSDLYAAVKADPKLAGIPVFHCSECGGAEPDNVGLQFLSIPPGAGTLMPDGTKYADYANVHNYVCDHLKAPIDNAAWDAEDPSLKGRWDGMVDEYGVTWLKHFAGYPASELANLPRVTTESGWQTSGPTCATSEEKQGKLLLNLYLDAFKRGWSYTFVYSLQDWNGQTYGFFRKNYTPKLSATYMHNFTSILADTPRSFIPGSLAYSIEGRTETVHDLLLEKSNGTFELVIWDERAAGSDTVKLSFGMPGHRASLYDPTSESATSPIKIFDSSLDETITLSDHPVIFEIAAGASNP
ncbi:MAG TPA: glycosyl hydrolase [Methylocella sp.]|nr:glycosyl hydrolase [Methylocella sp.]